MKTLPLLAEAKTLLDEAQHWYALAWASESNKKKVRLAIENATRALDREVAAARRSLKHPLLAQVVKKLKSAEADCQAATALAKKTFDEAEKELNPAKARLGALQAIHAIEKHEAVWKLYQTLCR
jgi:hypothetical protein